MPEVYSVLGQVKPAAQTLTTLYAVPALTAAVISTIVVCNQVGSRESYRISIAPAAAADDPAQYLYYNTPLFANDSYPITIGITLATADVIRVRSAGGNLSFSVFGAQVT